MGDINLASKAHEVFAYGYAETGPFPVPDQTKSVCVAAIKAAVEIGESEEVLTMVLEAGRKEGLFQLFLKRRSKLTKKHEDAARDAAQALAKVIPAKDFAKSILDELGVTESDNDSKRKKAKQLALALLLASLKQRSSILDAWMSAAALANAEAFAEGTAESQTWLAEREGSSFDLDQLYVDTLDHLTKLGSYWNDANSWVNQQVAGVAGDIGNAIADGLANGESYDAIIKSVGVALGDSDGAAWYAGEAFHTSMIRAMQEQYVSAAVQVDYIALPGACSVCEGYADGSPYDPEQVPMPPIHGGCRCDIEPAASSA